MLEINFKALIISVIIVVVTFFLLSFVKKVLIKKVAYGNKDAQHFKTTIGIVINILQYLIIIIAILLILKAFGFNITGLLAGLGVVATVVGLSLQDTLKDVFAGMNIYTNNFYKVGDIVIYQGRKCEVKYFSARITKFKDCISRSTYTVCNSTINSIEKVKDGQVILISFDVSDDKKKIDKAFNTAVKKIEADEAISDAVYLGIISIGREGAQYGISFNAPPADLAASARIYKILYDEFAKIKLSPNTDDNIKIKKDPWDL